MDFIDELRNFSSRATKVKDAVTSEDATKTSLVLPFFKLLGYDIFDPTEFVPEFTADIGIKKAEKVDYAIVIEGNPVILVECKRHGETLDKHSSQLFRYFGTTTAKFAILTDGIIYKFYTDLNEQNKMDLEPFLVFNVLDITEHLVSELRRFAKSTLDIETAYLAAVELKYTNKMKDLLSTARTDPPESFVRYMMGEIYSGRQTQSAIDMFRPIVKRGYNQYINDQIHETLKNAMRSQIDTGNNLTPDAKPEAEVQNTPASEAETPATLTQDEVEAFAIVRTILREICDVERIFHRPTGNYISVLLDDNRNKRVCRFWFKRKQKYITIPDEDRNPVRYDISNLNDIYNFAELLKEACNRHLTRGAFEEKDEEEAKE